VPLFEEVDIGFEFIDGSVHDWGTKKECLTEKGLQKTTLDFLICYIIIIAVDCYMPIVKVISFFKFKKYLKNNLDTI
jgi:hypothetical protein